MLEGFLVTMDIERAFDSLDHSFLISTLEKYGFAKNFILWVKILLRRRGHVLLTVVQLLSISHLGEVPIKVTNFSVSIYFSFRDMSYYKIET